MRFANSVGETNSSLSMHAGVWCVFNQRADPDRGGGGRVTNDGKGGTVVGLRPACGLVAFAAFCGCGGLAGCLAGWRVEEAAAIWAGSPRS